MAYKIIKSYGGVSLSPCPFCKKAERHRKSQDRRGPVELFANDNGTTGFYCFECNAKGLWDRISQATEGELATPPKAVTMSPPKEYPDPQRMQTFWSLLEPVSGEVLDYVCKKIPGATSVSNSLARQLPEQYAETEELSGWRRSKRRLVFPLYDSEGKIRNVIGRSISPTASIKSQSLSGYSRAGLFLQNCQDWRQKEKVVICEGESDLLAWSLTTEYAVLGIFGGSIGPWLRNIKEGASVLISTDLDAVGESYAQKILEHLPPSVTAVRWSPE